jgi:hypothetical protein
MPRRTKWGVGVELYSFFNPGAKWGGWSTPHPDRFTPRERPGTHSIGGRVGLRGGLDRCGKSRPPPGFDPRTVQPVASRYTDDAIPARKFSVLMVVRIYGRT